MGKKHGFGKRIVRLGKEERVRISSGLGADVRKHQEAVAAQSAAASGNHHLSAIMRLTHAGPRRVASFSDRHKILAVGEGDFSFSLSLAGVVGGKNMLCTSLDKPSQIQVKYGQGAAGVLNALRSMGAKLHHEVDACKLHEESFVSKQSFDRIIFNFPDLATASPTGEPGDVSIDFLANFLKSAASIMLPGCEIHVSLRKSDFAAIGKEIASAARAAGLQCSAVSDFSPSEFVGYKPQHTFPGSPSAKLSLLPAKLLVFTHAPPEKGSKRKAREQDNEEVDEDAHDEGEAGEEDEDEEEEGEEGGREEGSGKKKKKRGKKRKKRRGGKYGGDVLPQVPKVRESKEASTARSVAAFLLGR